MKQALWKAIEAYRHSTSIKEQWRNRDALDTLINAALSLAEFDAAAVQAGAQDPISSGHPDDAGFELWWSEHMPEAVQSVAISAWNAAQPTAQAQERKPLSEEEIKAEFGKLYPNDLPLIELSENNRDFALESIGARHHWRAFELGARAIEAAHDIKDQP